MVRHKINGVEIEEPVGFDNFKSTINRTEYHGVSAEVSVGDLEFYGDAFETINEAYNTDIDTELIYTVEFKCESTDDFVEIYRGVIDLSTYEETTADYCSVKCKVGEIGVKTTFNNRIETEIDITKLVDLDGGSLNSYSNINKKITIPAKGLLLQGKMSLETDSNSWGEENNGGVGSPLPVTNSTRTAFILPFGLKSLDELSGVNEIAIAPIYTLQTYSDQTYVYNVMYENGVFKNSSTDIVSNNFSVKGTAIFDIKLSGSRAFSIFRLSIKTVSVTHGQATDIWHTDLSAPSAGSWIRQNVPIDISGINIPIGTVLVCLFEFQMQDDDYGTVKNIDIKGITGSTISVGGLQIFEDTTAKVSLVHESLSRLTEMYCGVSVKSNYYSRVNSDINPLDSGVGPGALKAITTGLMLRNAESLTDNPAGVSISFKDLYLALNTIDNIGYGFSLENDSIFIRVESWEWFYKDDIILTIENPAGKTRKIDEKSIYSRFNFGFEKYESVEDINSIDAFHTERNYSSTLKAVDNKLEQICKFIADPYAIEFTRQKSADLTTTDWRYDDNIFIFALQLENNIFTGYKFSVDMGVNDSEGTIISPETMLNFRISPERNALRWVNSLFSVNKPSFKMTSGTGNTAAKGTPYSYPEALIMTLDDSSSGVSVSENSDILYKVSKLKSETLEFKYAITIEQYNSIKNDPYGIIQVDGEKCWIKVVEYNFNTSEANFKLIPKNE